MSIQFEHRGPFRSANARRIAYLLGQFIREQLTPAEHDELDNWVGASDQNMLLFEEVTREVSTEKGVAWMDEHVLSSVQLAEKELTFPERKSKWRRIIFVLSLLLITCYVIFYACEW